MARPATGIILAPGDERKAERGVTTANERRRARSRHGPSVLTAAALGVAAALAASPAAAEVLGVYPGAPLWSLAGGYALLALHVGGGAVGLASGFTAIASRRGTRLHRQAGTVFFVAMAVSYAVGAGVAPFLQTGQRPNFVAGVLALYLLFTAWRAARQPTTQAGGVERTGLVAALGVAAMGALFMHQGAQDPSGTVDGSPPQAFALFLVLGLAAAAGDAHLLLRRGLSGANRISRHLWRMCASLFIASTSFFYGQQQLLPEAVRGTVWQAAPVILPVLAIVYGLATTRWPGLVRGRRRAGARPS